MNNKYGLRLNKLLISNGKEFREVTFYKGLNFISGPTDTGKTYVYQLIKYLLGSNTKPKDIPENQDLNNVFLELISNSTKKTITLNRKLGTNKIYIYECPIDEVSDTPSNNSFNTKGSKNIIGKQLLFYAGLEENYSIKTKINDEGYQNINFRDYLHFSLVDEVNIIKETSPLITGQYTSKTFELNFFYYLISNASNHYLTYLSLQKQKNKKKSSQKKNNENSIASILYQTQNEISALEEQFNKSKENSYSNEIVAITNEIKEKSNELHTLLKNNEKLKSKILMNNELIKRFTLLKEQFTSDLERLEFILEGGSIISNLLIETCTICGGQLSINDHKHSNLVEENSLDLSSLQESYTSERNKILINLNDLKETTEILLKENHNLHLQLTNNEVSYKLLDNQITNELKPTKESLEQKIEAVVEKRLIQQKILFLEQVKKKLEMKKENDSDFSPQNNIIKSNDAKVSSTINDLCNRMSDYLDEMKWKPDTLTTKVEFDYNAYDFLIDGKLRSVYGKGYRAIIYAVFLISLMKHCKVNDLPHTDFIVLDSPLTTYQEGDEMNKDENIPDDLKQRFIQIFSKEKESQIIILDNQFDIVSKTKNFHYIEFSKNYSEGRYGFI